MLKRSLLQDDRVDPSALSNSAIRLASHSDCIEVVRLLLDDKRVLDYVGIDDIVANMAS